MFYAPVKHYFVFCITYIIIWKSGTFWCTKRFMYAIFVFGIAIWFMYESHRLCDLSQAYALLGIVASLAPVIFGYYSKSKAENTEGGIVYETVMKEQETASNSESGKG